MNPNDNVLDGFKCPKCGTYGPFWIRCLRDYLFCDEGSIDETGDFEWDDDTHCRCSECDFEGAIKDFHASDPDPDSDEAEGIP